MHNLVLFRKVDEMVIRKSLFNVGDLVTLQGLGGTYQEYYSAFFHFCTAFDLPRNVEIYSNNRLRFKLNEDCVYTKIWKIKGIAAHSIDDRTLVYCLTDKNGNMVLASPTYLKLIQQNPLNIGKSTIIYKIKELT